jgi:hypothetical protein
MSNTSNHPVITDNVPEAVSFLPWLQSRGYSIRLALEGNWITATLIGTQRVWYCYGESGIELFYQQGRTKEEAIANLMRWCSGAKHYPKGRKSWFIAHDGPEEQFPPFKE